jgi:FMN phosphatase YigB (HAD superfamily)
VPKDRPLLITDLDNTIYNWVDFYAPSFRAMVHVLSREMGLGEEAIIDEFRAVYGEKGSLEYSFSVQELPSVRCRGDHEVSRLVMVAKGAFSRVREAHLRPYPGVKETLTWLLREGVVIVGATNAPMQQAEGRLRHLYLDRCFSGLAGWEGHDIPAGIPLMAAIKQRAVEGKYRSHVEVLWPLHQSELKPSPTGYLRIMEQVGASPESTYVVGDSLHKDVRPALQVGATGVWARYGSAFEKKNFDTLLKITHWSSEKVSAVYDEQAVEPTYTIDSFSELQTIIQVPQARLF